MESLSLSNSFKNHQKIELNKSNIFIINNGSNDDGATCSNDNDGDIEKLNNFFNQEVLYENDIIEFIKINLDNAYFIAGQRVSGNIEISLNNDIPTSGINLTWKCVENVLINHYQQVSSSSSSSKKNNNKEHHHSNNLSESTASSRRSSILVDSPSFEIIDSSPSPLKSSINSSLRLSTNNNNNQNCGTGINNNGGIGNSNYLNYNNYHSSGGTLKKNSKFLNVLKSSTSISSFLKISSSSSSINIETLSSSSSNNCFINGINGDSNNVFPVKFINIEKKKEKKILYKSNNDLIFNTDDTNGIMNSGLHIIPFSFLIPSHLPSSFSDYTIDKETNDKIVSSILYSCNIEFIECPLKSLNNDEHDFKLKKHFSVLEPSIIAAMVNEIPLRVEKKKSFLISSGVLNIKIQLKRNVFFYGEKIPIQLFIENQSSKNIDYILISIKKVQNIKINENQTTNRGGGDSTTTTNESNNGVKKCSFKTSEKYQGVNSHSNFNEIIQFNTWEIKNLNQTTNGDMIKCHYKLIVQCFVKRALNIVVDIPILFGGSIPITSLNEYNNNNFLLISQQQIFNDDYQLNLLNM